VKRARVEEGAYGIISIWYSRTTGSIRTSLGRKNKYTNKHASVIFLLVKKTKFIIFANRSLKPQKQGSLIR
jgi:hypothetical protein